MQCAFCTRTVLDTEEAINAGWEPSYWVDYADDENGCEMSDPICPKCQKEHCDYTDVGLVLKPGHENASSSFDERRDLLLRIKAQLDMMPLARLRALALILGS